MGSLLHDPSLVQYKDLICFLYGFEPVGDHQDRLVAHQRLHGFLQFIFILRINICRCLIKDNDGRVFQHCPRNGDALFLAAG